MILTQIRFNNKFKYLSSEASMATGYIWYWQDDGDIWKPFMVDTDVSCEGSSFFVIPYMYSFSVVKNCFSA